MGTSLSLCRACLPCKAATETAREISGIITWITVNTRPATPTLLPWKQEHVNAVSCLVLDTTQPAEVLINIDYCSQLLQSINQFRESGLFTELVFVVGRKEFSVHRNVLVAFCKNVEIWDVKQQKLPDRIYVAADQEIELHSSDVDNILTAFYTQNVRSLQVSGKHPKEDREEIFTFKLEDEKLMFCREINAAKTAFDLRAVHILAKLEAYRTNGYFCDVTVTSGNGRSLRCHKNVLAAGSDFFLGLFLSGMQEAQNNCIDLSAMDEDIIDDILKYMYTGEIVLTFNNVTSLLEASDYLLINSLKENIVNFLTRNLTIQTWWLSRTLAARYNCKELYELTNMLTPATACCIRSLARQHNCTELYEAAGRYIQEHFALIYPTQGFLSLSPDDIMSFVSDDSLLISEELILRALLSWVEHDIAERKVHLKTLVQFIHMIRLRKCYLSQEMESEGHSLDTRLVLLTEAKEQLKELMKAKDESKNVAVEIDEDYLEKRIWVTLQKSVKGRVHSMQFSNFSLLCVNRVSNCTAYMWIPLENALFEFVFPECFCLHEVVQHNDTFYAILSVIECASSDISVAPSLNHSSPTNDKVKQCSVPECEPERLGKTIVQIHWGGVGNVKKSLAEGTHKEAKTINHYLLHYAVSSLGDCIYILGGYHRDDLKQTPLPTVQRFHTTKDAWEEVTGMNTPRAYHCATTLHQALFVIGGIGKNGTRLSSVEKYNSETNTWAEVTPLTRPRWAANCCTLHEKLYVLGGLDNTWHSVRYCEVYDPQTQQWQILHDTLAQPYDGFLTVTNLAGVNVVVEKAAGNKLFVYGLDIDTGARSQWAWTIEIPTMPEITDILPLNRAIMNKLARL